MEDAASEISDWEVLSATSACGAGGDEEEEVVIVSGGGGDVVLDHFALTPDPAAAACGGGDDEGEGSWSGHVDGAWQGLELLDGFDPIPESGFNLVAGARSQQPPISGGDNPREDGPILQATLARGDNQEEVVDAEIEQESDSVISCGELYPPVLQPAHHGVGEALYSDATAPIGAPLQNEESESSLVQLDDGGIGAAGVYSSCLGDDVPSDAIHGEEEEEHEQGSSANGDAPDGEAKDGALTLAYTPGAEEGEKQVVVWWRLPLRLLHFCAWKVKPVWSFSIAAALLGLVVLGRRMYRMKRKAKGLPQIKIAFDDKRASQFADRAARLNEAFLIARRVPMLRTSSGATLPWSMVQDR